MKVTVRFFLYLTPKHATFLFLKTKQGATCGGWVQNNDPIKNTFFLGRSTRAMFFIRKGQKNIATT